MTEATNTTGKPIARRARSRRTAAWKSGLGATGLGAVVLGAGYFAGISLPTANAAQAASNPLAAQAIGRQAVTPSLSGDNSQQFIFQGDDGMRKFSRGRHFEFDDAGAVTLGQQQPAPRFLRPVTRSRGS